VRHFLTALLLLHVRVKIFVALAAEGNALKGKRMSHAVNLGYLGNHSLYSPTRAASGSAVTIAAGKNVTTIGARGFTR
jgi:hypothetical protein